MKNWIQFYSRGKTKRLFYIYTLSEYFKAGEEFIIKATEDCIRFIKPSLSYIGKTNKVTKAPHWEDVHKLNFAGDIEIPISKKFYIDEEESNEDVVVVYFNKQTENN